MKKVLSALVVIILIWVSVTFYFITQHTIVAKEATLNQTIVFDDVTVNLDRYVFLNAERKQSSFENNKWKYELAEKLPNGITMNVMRLLYLYSSPYDIKEKGYTTTLAGSWSFNENMEGTEDAFRYINDNIEISIQDSIGYGYNSGMGMRQENGNPVMDFWTHGQDIYLERMTGGITISVKHKKSGEEKVIHLGMQDFQQYEYNDSFGMSRKLISFIR